MVLLGPEGHMKSFLYKILLECTVCKGSLCVWGGVWLYIIGEAFGDGGVGTWDSNLFVFLERAMLYNVSDYVSIVSIEFLMTVLEST
jgi:hypothetical protein